MADENRSWALEDFVDSLVVELDKTRETLAVKTVNKPLSYSVKEMALDLSIFPSYDGDRVRFVTAGPGEQGASKVTIQLGSITDQQVRATTRLPTKGDGGLEDVAIDEKSRRSLRRIGVNSVSDLRSLQDKQVDLRSVSDGDVDYNNLANQIRKGRRNENPPRIDGVSLSASQDGRPVLTFRGARLAIDPTFPPVAVVDDRLADVVSASDDEVSVRLPATHQFNGSSDVIMTFDPYAVVKVAVRG